jgi:hypothetical protein
MTLTVIRNELGGEAPYLALCGALSHNAIFKQHCRVFPATELRAPACLHRSIEEPGL